MDQIDGLYSFRMLGGWSIIDGQDHLEWEIESLDSLGFLSKFPPVEFRQEKSSTIDGQVGWIGEDFGLVIKVNRRWSSIDYIKWIVFNHQRKSLMVDGSMVNHWPIQRIVSYQAIEFIDGWWREEGDDVSCHINIHVSCYVIIHMSCHVIQFDTLGWCVMPHHHPCVIPRQHLPR